MPETIDLIALRKVKRGLAAFTRETDQPTSLDLMDIEPLTQMKSIEITEEHITIQYNEEIAFRYNANSVTYKEWEYKYNDDPEFVAAIAKVVELARKHLRDLPENLACPPGCGECCSGYEPFVSEADVRRIAEHLGLSYRETLDNYVVKRLSADGFNLGYLRKTTDDVADRCVFLKGRASGEHYCGVYSARPRDCRAFTPIGCTDVNDSLPRKGEHVSGPAFRPRHARHERKR
jgi:Fe-S-cluster containining protein